ncbi:hypothetical protein PR048_019255 [Dryococelus australis]|uniref:Uncharacterized protein n=1 Tax=Dryococelus australis TaxID=614101 RepID=A0ABQ9H2Z5_9NEOP|nr:hypothetical protein PR048_019255 [Dryococelus australis]
MQPFKTYFSEEICQWLRSNCKNLGPCDIVELFGHTYNKVKIVKLLSTGLESQVSSLRTDTFSKTTTKLLLNMVDKALFKPNDKRTKEIQYNRTREMQCNRNREMQWSK